jgi:hypothetical protein
MKARSASNTSFVSQVRDAIEEIGYRRVGNPRGLGARDVWYERDRGESPIVDVLHLEFMPKFKSYRFLCGIYDLEEKELSHCLLPFLTRFIDPILLNSDLISIDSPCWTVFNLGRALWPRSLMSIPNPLNRGSWRSQLEEAVNKYLRPIFWSIKTKEAIVELLYGNEKPFEWFATVPVLRVAEIVALSSLSGIDPRVVRSRILKFDREIRPKLYGTLSTSRFIEELQAEVDGVLSERGR